MPNKRYSKFEQALTSIKLSAEFGYTDTPALAPDASAHDFHGHSDALWEARNKAIQDYREQSEYAKHGPPRRLSAETMAKLRKALDDGPPTTRDPGETSANMLREDIGDYERRRLLSQYNASSIASHPGVPEREAIQAQRAAAQAEAKKRMEEILNKTEAADSATKDKARKLEQVLEKTKYLKAVGPAAAALAAGHHAISSKHEDNPNVRAANSYTIPALTGAGLGALYGGGLGLMSGRSPVKSALVGATLGGTLMTSGEAFQRNMARAQLLDRTPEQIRDYVQTSEKPLVAGNTLGGAILGGLTGGSLGAASSLGGGHVGHTAVGAIGGALLGGSLGYRYGRTAVKNIKDRAALFGVDTDAPAEKEAAAPLFDRGALIPGRLRQAAKEFAEGLRERNTTPGWMGDKPEVGKSRIGDIVEWLGDKAEGIHLPPELQNAPDLKGVNRAKQVLLGYRPKDLYERSRNMEPGEARDTVMRSLMDEDRATGQLRSKIKATAGGAAMAGMAGGQYLIGKALKKVVPSSFRSIDDGGETVSEEERARREQLIDDSPGARALAERFGDRDASKHLTVQDLTGAATGTAAAAALTKHTAPDVAANLLGVRRGYHGTTTDAAQKIMQTGLDPSFGGGPGGATEKLDARGRIVKELAKDRNQIRLDPEVLHKLPIDLADSAYRGVRDGHIQSAIEDIQPRMPLMTQGEVGIPVDTTNYMSNARNRTYVGDGAHGFQAAKTYARMQDPALVERVQMEARQRQLEALNEGRFGDAMSAAFEASAPEVKAERVVSSSIPGQGRVISVTMPHEKYTDMFEPDPDDVTRFGTGMRSRRTPEGGPVAPIGKEHLELGEASLGNIIRNRSKDMRRYIREDPTRFAKGVAGLGLNAAAHGANLYFNARPIIQKLRGTFKTKREQQLAEQAAEAASAAEPTT